MTRILLFVVFSIMVLFASCTTSGFAGLAKESYALEVEQKTTADIQALRDEVAKVKALTDQLDGLLKDIEATKKSTKEFQDLVKELEGRINTMPKESIAELVKVLQKYLDEKK
jgi:peptidoglycan hydrolase CwlO-like protein